MKKKILLLLVLFLLFDYSFTAIKLVRVGVVDIEKVFQAYPGIEDIQKKLKQEREKIEVEVNKRNEKIKILEEQLKNSNLSEAEKQTKIAELEYEKQTLANFIDDNNSKLSSLREELTKPIYSRIWLVIQRVGRERGYSIIIKKSSDAILYFDKEIDVTSEVITKLTKEMEIEKRN